MFLGIWHFSWNPNSLCKQISLFPFFQRRHWHLILVLLPGKSHGRQSLVGCNPWGHEESDTTERLHFHFHALEKEGLLALWYECIFQLSRGLCTLLSVIFVHILLSMFPFYIFFRLSACPISSTVQLHFGLFSVVFISFTVLLTNHYIFLVLKSNVFIYFVQLQTISLCSQCL